MDTDKCLKNGITPTPGPPGGDPQLGGIRIGLPDLMGPPGASSGQPGGMGTRAGMGLPDGMAGMGPPGGMETGLMGYPDLNSSTIGYNSSTGGYNPSTSGYNPQPTVSTTQ